MSNEKILEEGSVGKLLITLSLPVILVMLVTVIYNMADVFFLGQAGDSLQVAAVSLVGPLFGRIRCLHRHKYRARRRSRQGYPPLQQLLSVYVYFTWRNDRSPDADLYEPHTFPAWSQ